METATDAAFDSLGAGDRDRIVFILDCDGSVDARLKGQRGLILTKHREIEADLLFELRAMVRVAHEFMATTTATTGDVDTAVEETLNWAAWITSSIGIVQLAA